MKYNKHLNDKLCLRVALFTRAWIEITLTYPATFAAVVALFTRAWIEIFCDCKADDFCNVALFTRAWIEISENEPFAL